ncbi:carbohydrate ABC transporter permease [Streptomyces sp. NPDC001351]|uniref:carbohydrate ABC transporter permease n=1 Tax=Streptomyces sp. NPDC001351 TaxID=3364564 RepID=UPI0036848866
MSSTGLSQGFAGLRNYADLFAEGDLPGVLLCILVWVIRVVTVVVLLGRSHCSTPGFRAPVGAVGADGAVGLVRADGRGGVRLAPFTSFVLLAGVRSIPAVGDDEARMDGAGPVRGYLAIALPLLRPSLVVAAIINVINGFNSFPVIWAMTRGGPGFAIDTTTTYLYKLAFDNQSVGESATMAVVNFGLVLAVVLVYLNCAPFCSPPSDGWWPWCFSRPCAARCC